jgi:hypothetical protein
MTASGYPARSGKRGVRGRAATTSVRPSLTGDVVVDEVGAGVEAAEAVEDVDFTPRAWGAAAAGLAAEHATHVVRNADSPSPATTSVDTASP